MRKRGLLAGTAVLVLLCGSCRGLAEDRWYLRVIGRDDTVSGQAEKLRVRDAALSALQKEADLIPDCLNNISAAANAVAPCEAEIRIWQPDEKTPPAPTVYITVGSGQGHNWWGILYRDALLLAKMEGEEDAPGQPVFVWPLWERLMQWLGLWQAQPAPSSRMIERIPSSLVCIS